MKKLMLLVMSAMAFAAYSGPIEKLAEKVKALEDWKNYGVVKICGIEIGDTEEDLLKKNVFDKNDKDFKSLSYCTSGRPTKPFRQFSHVKVEYSGTGKAGKAYKIKMFMKSKDIKEMRAEAEHVAALIEKKFGFELKCERNSDFEIRYEKRWDVPWKGSWMFVRDLSPSVVIHKISKEDYMLEVVEPAENYFYSCNGILVMEIEHPGFKEYNDALNELTELREAKAKSESSNDGLDAL